MKRAVIPGSFDPITNGHLDIIKRASKIFDEVIVAVLVNNSKHPTFSTDERLNLINIAIKAKNINNVKTDTFSGLLADYAKKNNIQVIIKGLRAMSDFEYEFQMSLTNKKMNKDLETMFLNTNQKYMYLSSSIVREIGSYNGDIHEFVPKEIHDIIKQRLLEINNK